MDACINRVIGASGRNSPLPASKKCEQKKAALRGLSMDGTFVPAVVSSPAIRSIDRDEAIETNRSLMSYRPAG